MDEKRSKRSYAVRGCYAQKNNFGEMYEKTEQRHEMPQIGEYVIILENTQLERSKDGVVAKYKPSSAYLDVHGRPEVFEVVGFSKGRENPLEEGNYVLLYREFERNKGCGHRTQIPCVRVAVGNVRLQKVSEHYMMHDRIEDALNELALNNGIVSAYGVGTNKRG